MSEPLQPTDLADSHLSAAPGTDPLAAAATYPTNPAGGAHTPTHIPDRFDEQPPLTPMQRVVDTFVAPSKTFADIRRNRSWWLPFLILALFGYLFSGVAYKRVSMPGLVESALKSNPARYEKFKESPPAQQAQARSITGLVMQSTLLGWPIYQLLFTAISALLLWVGFNFILGGSSTYGGMFAVSMFAMLPGLVRSLLSTLMLFVGDPETFSISDPVGTNPGYYLGPDAAAWLRSLLGSFDLFSLWILLLCALGGAIVARVKPSRGYALVFGAWLLFVLVKVGFAAATS